MAMKLRPYQVRAVDDLRELIRRGRRRVLLQAGTGAGKTVIAAEIIKSADDRQSHSLFLAHRRELVFQCSRKLRDFNVPHGIIMAGEQPLARYCQVASIQTLWSRFRRFGRSHLPQADLLVFDECHRSLAPTYEKLVEQYPDALLIGLTATPARGDGRGLGDVYEDMVQCPPIPVLQEQEFLVGTRYFAPTIPDLEGLTVRAGDYVESELEERMDKPVLVGDIVEHWGRLGSDRKTVVFATSVKHSIHLCNQFREAGVRCEHIDGSTPTGERDTILADLSRGEVQVVTNCMVLTEGWDQPDVSCAALARPTKSLVLYLQMVGRILRAYPGKKDALIIDHAGTIHQHGFVEEFTDWTLEPDTVQQNPIQAKRQEHDVKPITCTNCFATYVGRPVCPECGHANVRKGRGGGLHRQTVGRSLQGYPQGSRTTVHVNR